MQFYEHAPPLHDELKSKRRQLCSVGCRPKVLAVPLRLSRACFFAYCSAAGPMNDELKSEVVDVSAVLAVDFRC